MVQLSCLLFFLLTFHKIVFFFFRHENDEDFLTQIVVFDEQKQQDDDMMVTGDGLDLNDHQQVFRAVFDQVCNSLLFYTNLAEKNISELSTFWVIFRLPINQLQTVFFESFKVS